MDTFLSTLSTQTSGLYAIILLTILLLYIATLLLNRHWQHIRQQGKRVRQNIIPTQTLESAYNAADIRREKILNILYETERSDFDAPEFIELPPTLSEALFTQSQKPENLQERQNIAHWRTARLLMQLNESRYLLTERVTDLIVSLLRAEKIRPHEFPSAIFLERLHPNTGDAFFPWRVVIETNYPRALAPWFLREGVLDWIGIGIQFSVPIDRLKDSANRRDDGTSTPPLIFSLGKCIVGTNGREGTVGGVFRHSTGVAEGLTCRHVLTSTCNSLRWPEIPGAGATGFSELFPDAALIDLRAPCFKVGGTKSRRVSIANAGQIDSAVSASTKIRKSTNNTSLNGIIKHGYLSSFNLGTSFYRGHHFVVQPEFKKRLGIIFPIIRSFAKPGHSGDWILDEKLEVWFGMVVGGYVPPNIGTVVLSAELIANAYTLHIKNTQNAAAFFSPEIYVD